MRWLYFIFLFFLIAQASPNPTLFKPVSSLNLTAFPYDRKEDFHEVLETRMEFLDQGIDELRAKINAMPSGGGEILQQRLTDISESYESANDRLKDIDDVSINGWSTYKRVLRDEIASLEQSYEQLQVAAR